VQNAKAILHLDDRRKSSLTGMNKRMVISLLFLTVICIMATFPNWIAPQEPFKQSDNPFQAPSLKNMFGTDELGRDISSRIVYGARTALAIAIGAGMVALILGLLIGGLSGYYGGVLGNVFSRLTELFFVIPRLFILIVVMAIYGSNFIFVVIIIGLTAWPQVSRITAAQVLTIKKRGFVQAAIGLGASDIRTLFDHVIPNSAGPILANLSITMAWAILTEASLSFLGLGDQNVVSWGQMIQSGQYHPYQWWLSLFPGLFILVFVLSLNFISDGVAQILNPRLR
jgi:peptide/nickel transport system permease protein